MFTPGEALAIPGCPQRMKLNSCRTMRSLRSPDTACVIVAGMRKLEYRRSARRSVGTYLILLVGLAFLWAGATVDPDLSCGTRGSQCAPWLIPITLLIGGVATSMGLGMLAFNRKWGSRLDVSQRCLLWWDSAISADTHHIPLDEVARIKVQHPSESTGQVFFYGQDGRMIRFTEERAVPDSPEEWARDLATLFPHLSVEVEEA